jgi:signal transduction histidine kinase
MAMADTGPTNLTSSATPQSPRGAAELAHELNNLLDGSLRSVELAIRRLRDTSLDETQRDALGKLETADRLMLRMIDVIDAWAQIPTEDRHHGSQAGVREVLEDHDTTLGDAMRYAMHAFGPNLDDRGITLAAIVDQDAAALPAGAMYSVLVNAIRNAQQSIEQRRHDKPGGSQSDRIELQLDLDDDQVMLTVTDTGAGLDPSLFDEHGRLRTGITTKQDGHGIGLGICKQIAEKLGGRLTLSNRKPRGAVLILRYPVGARSVD